MLHSVKKKLKKQLSLNYNSFTLVIHMNKIILIIAFSLTLNTLFAQVDSALVIAKEVKARLDKGANFCEMVRLYSEDTQTKTNCGEIGFFGKGELSSTYEDAMVKLKVGQISDIIKTGYGYHIIQLTARDKKEYGTRHILIKHR